MDFTAYPKPYVTAVPLEQQPAERESTKPLLAMVRSKIRSHRASTASIVLAMKMTIVLLTAALIHVQAAVVAQTVTLTGRNISVKKIFQSIKQQTGYVTFYNQEMLADAKPVSLEVNGLPLEDVLKLIAKDQPFRFEIKANTKTIVVAPKVVTTASPGTSLEAAFFVPLSGQIVDSASGAPLPGATVKVQGTVQIATTDYLGRFTVNAKAGDVLTVSYVGFRSVSYTIRNTGKPLIIALAPAITTINNVVVTGIFNKNKESYTGAVKVITAKDLQQFQGRNIFVTIGNIDPSFYVVPNNSFGSNPNRVPDIQLRGTRNLPNLDQIDQLGTSAAAALNSPLVIMDGFESTMERLMDLNNNEIESITLLKDGGATSLYGSRGANGVIVVTTKLPVSGKLRFTYRAGMNLSVPDLSSYHLLNAKDKLELERISGYYSSPTKPPSQNVGLEQYYNQILGLVQSGVNTDWLSKPLRSTVDQNHSIKLEGGDNAFRYSLQGQYNKINGIMKGSGRENINGNVDLSYRLGKLNFRNSLMIGSTKGEESPWGSFSDYAKLNPYWSPYDADGKITQSFQPYYQSYWDQGQHLNKPYANPMYDATLNTFNKNAYTNITNNFQLDWSPVDHLRLYGSLGITNKQLSSDAFKPASHSAFSQYTDSNLIRRGTYDYSSGKEFSYTARAQAVYSNLFNDLHSLYIGVSVEAAESKSTNYMFSAEGFPDETIDFIGEALQYTLNGAPSGTEATTRRVGLASTLTYTYDQRYTAELNYRVDGASQFGTDKRFAPFWSAGAGWNLQNESFIRDNFTFIDRLKLRGSFGVTGNQNFNAYQPLATYGYITNDRYKNWIGAVQKALGNPDLQWQKTNKYDLGIEGELFKKRILFQADYYKEHTSNLLSSLELPYSNGFTDYIENIGEVEQTGFELTATVVAIRNDARRIFWSVTGSIAHNQDKIVKLSEAMKAANEKLATDPDKVANLPNRIIREGTSQNTIYAVPSLGIDPSTGRELFLNKDGGVTYSWNPRDRVAVGVSEPKYRGNFSTLFRYGGFGFNTSFGFRFGGQLYNETLIQKIENADRFFNVDERVYNDRWKKPGDRTFFRGINEVTRTYASSRFVQNESTFICQNINISYDVLNREWLRRLHMQALSVQANTGELFYMSSVPQERGIDYPFSRQVSVSLFATF
ncbi:SusC/RagA family TonB-linked outer membrane protein [Chitinophaga sp. SYP-B3965]|nr:SusC/RagA family TonB-linked outer membrane protein [Chitinophaga sp. SYP-B3965]